MKHQLREEFTKNWAADFEAISAQQSSVKYTDSSLDKNVRQIIHDNEQVLIVGYYTIQGKNYYIKECDELLQFRVYPLFRDKENLLNFTSKDNLYDKTAVKIENYFSSEDRNVESNDDIVINHINRTPIIKIKSHNTKKRDHSHNDIVSFASNIKHKQVQSRKLKQLSLAYYERNIILSYKHLEYLFFPKATFCK